MKKIEVKDIILMIICLITFLINIILFTKISLKSNQTISNQIQQNITDTYNLSEEEKELAKLREMTERDRMEFYFSKFISYIKSEDYETAYNLLYPEFKENYFKTQEEFEKYVKKTYPKSVGFSYNDIERQGSIYVLIIKIIDTNKKIGEEKTQRVVIKENDYNNFVLSFQVL